MRSFIILKKISKLWNPRFVCFVSLVFAMTIAGCGKPKDIPAELMKVDYQERHPIKVHKYLADVRLDVKQGRSGLTEQQKGRLREFIRKYKREGNGDLLVATPSGGENDVSVYKAMGDIRAIIDEQSIAPGLVQFKSFNSADLAAHSNTSDFSPGQIRVAYRHYVARARDCGDWSENLANNHKNLNYPNFGCSQQYNLASMIADPRDLETHRGLAPRSSSRRDTIWDKYVKGDSTIAKRASEEKGTVSDVAKE